MINLENIKSDNIVRTNSGAYKVVSIMKYINENGESKKGILVDNGDGTVRLLKEDVIDVIEICNDDKENVCVSNYDAQPCLGLGEVRVGDYLYLKSWGGYEEGWYTVSHIYPSYSEPSGLSIMVRHHSGDKNLDFFVDERYVMEWKKKGADISVTEKDKSSEEVCREIEDLFEGVNPCVSLTDVEKGDYLFIEAYDGHKNGWYMVSDVSPWLSHRSGKAISVYEDDKGSEFVVNEEYVTGLRKKGDRIYDDVRKESGKDDSDLDCACSEILQKCRDELQKCCDEHNSSDCNNAYLELYGYGTGKTLLKSKLESLRGVNIREWNKAVSGRFDELMPPTKRDYDVLIVEKAGLPVDVKITLNYGGEKVRKVVIHDDNNHLWNYLVNVKYANCDKLVLIVPEGHTESWEQTELWFNQEMREELDAFWVNAQVQRNMSSTLNEI